VDRLPAMCRIAVERVNRALDFSGNLLLVENDLDQ
jgi:hypothetical protein